MAFYKVTSNGFTVRANSAYLSVSLGTGSKDMFGVDEETNGISTIENSQLTNGNWYDLSGRRVAQPTKGIYIVNGKKVVVK